MKIHTKGQSDLTKKASPVRRNAFRSFTTLTPFTSTCLYNRLTLFLKVHSRFHELFITLYDSNIMKLRVCGRFLDHPNHHTLKFLLYVPVLMPVRQYILCTAKTAQCSICIIGSQLRQSSLKQTLHFLPLYSFCYLL